MSMIKTNDEIMNLKKAAQIGSDCFEYICSVIKPRNDGKGNFKIYL